MAESRTIGGNNPARISISRPVVAKAQGHISVFYPTIVILDIYVCAWALLVAYGQGGKPLTEVMAFVCFVVVPMLFAHAFIRYLTVSVIVTRKEVLIRCGWPLSGVQSIPLEELSNARADFSYLGRMTGAGTVTLTTCDGERYCIRDIASAGEIADRLNAIVKAIYHHSQL